MSAQTNRTRGLWHMQPWVSVAKLRSLVAQVTSVSLPERAQVALLERCRVDEVIKVARSAPGVLQ